MKYEGMIAETVLINGHEGTRSTPTWPAPLALAPTVAWC